MIHRILREPLTGALIAGGASVLGSVASSAFNMMQANKNRDWQEEMSNTAHQREMADMRKAGLNPLLAGTGGGASSPPGNVSQAENPVKDATSSALSMMQSKASDAQIADINSAKHLKDVQAQDLVATQSGRLAMQIAELQQLKSNTIQSDKKSQEIDQLIQNLKAQIPQIASQVPLNEANTALAKATVTNLRADSQKKETLGQIYGETNSAFKMAKQESKGWRQRMIDAWEDRKAYLDFKNQERKMGGNAEQQYEALRRKKQKQKQNERR